VLRKEYFDCPQKDITLHLQQGGEGSLYCTLVLVCSLATVLFCMHRPLCEDRDKIPEGMTSTLYLYSPSLCTSLKKSEVDLENPDFQVILRGIG
jgi:hypothetical protein